MATHDSLIHQTKNQAQSNQELRLKVVEGVEKKSDVLLNTFKQHLRNKYNRYFFGFIGCETLNIAMVIFQVTKHLLL